MKIVNPLYDKAFKYLMENTRLATKVLEVILETDIVDLRLEQQETVVPDEKRGFTLFRLDFKAIIQKEDGTQEKILIELQKSKFDTDIKRFRNYLGANYISKPEKAENQTQEKDCPIVTIYILGYNLDDLPHLAVTVNNQIIDTINKIPLELDSFFVKMLTHRSYILQVKRLPEVRKSRLEQFMTLFNQAWYADKKYILDLEEIPEEFRDIAEYLQMPVLDENFRRQLETEDEIDYIFDQQEAKYLKKIAQAEDKAAQAEAKAEQAKTKIAQAEAKAEQAKTKIAQAEAKVEHEKKGKEEIIKKMVIKFKAKGFSSLEIARDLELNISEVEQILNKKQ